MSAPDLSVIMSNLAFDMTCRGHSQFVEAMKLLCAVEGIGGTFGSGRPAGFNHYIVKPAEAEVRDAERPYLNKRARPVRLVMIRAFSAKDDLVKLPFAMDPELAARFAWGWLVEAAFPTRPDHDGDNERGWRLHNADRDGWVGDCVTIEPAWAVIGK